MKPAQHVARAQQLVCTTQCYLVGVKESTQCNAMASQLTWSQFWVTDTQQRHTAPAGMKCCGSLETSILSRSQCLGTSFYYSLWLCSSLPLSKAPFKHSSRLKESALLAIPARTQPCLLHQNKQGLSDTEKHQTGGVWHLYDLEKRALTSLKIEK